MDSSNRGQSEMVGTVLMIGIVVLAVTGLGITGLSLLAVDDAPSAMFSVDVYENATVVTHGGGDTVDPSTLVVRLTVDGTPLRYSVADDGLREPATAQFRPGDRWALTEPGLPYDPGDEVEVWLIHTPSNSILDRSQHRANGTISAEALP